MNKNNLVSKEINNYFSYLHCESSLDNVILSDSSFSKLSYKSIPASMSNAALYKINNTKRHTCFASVNRYAFHQNKNKYIIKRTNQYLSSFSVICLDLDIEGKGFELDAKTRYRESEIVDFLKLQSNRGIIPLPSAVSYTGTGGLHLYWKFNHSTVGAAKLIDVVKYELAEKIAEQYNELDDYMEGIKYRIDMNSMDRQRMDRVPGSIHDCTGRMCTFHIIGKQYNLSELAKELSEDRYKYTYIIKNIKYRISRYENGYSVGTCIKYPKYKKKKKKYTKTKEDLAQNRIDQLFMLAKSGYKFQEHRELACFLLKVWCKDIEMDKTDTYRKLQELNHMFYSPLAETELNKIIRQNKQYKFTNYKVQQMLGIVGNKEFYAGKRIYKNKHKEILDTISKIKEYVSNGLKIREIAELLKISISKVKRLKLSPI